jgi:hypothetical protein
MAMMKPGVGSRSCGPLTRPPLEPEVSEALSLTCPIPPIPWISV